MAADVGRRTAMTIDWGVAALHGSFFALVLAAFALGILRFNPRLFIKHFPESVRQSQPPLSRSEMMVGYAIGLPFLIVIVGGPVLAAWLFHQATGASGASVFVHAFIVGMTANLADWLIVDLAILGGIRPAWAAPAGVAISEIPFEHGRHFVDFLKGGVGFALIAGLAMWIVQSV